MERIGPLNRNGGKGRQRRGGTRSFSLVRRNGNKERRKSRPNEISRLRRIWDGYGVTLKDRVRFLPRVIKSTDFLSFVKKSLTAQIVRRLPPTSEGRSF